MNKHLLVIEDNPEVRENLCDILELSGFRVSSAVDGKEGVNKALEITPDLIICDVMMPKLDGFGVLNILSRRPETYHIPFIFLTAKTEKEDIRRGMTLGADDYVTKPFYKDELLRVIEVRLRKAEKLQPRASENEQRLTAFFDAAKGLKRLNKLTEGRKDRLYGKKEVLFREGDYPRYFYFVKSGEIKLSKINDFGKEFILKTVNKGEFFGYTAIIENTEYAFSAVPTEESKVIQIPREDFTELLYADRDVSAGFIKLLANNLIKKEEQLLSLAYNSVRKRTAETLCSIYRKQNEEGVIRVLREDLARMVGTAKESVIRILTEFKKDGLIQIEEGEITVSNYRKLQDIPG